MKTIEYSFSRLSKRLRELSFLNKGLAISIEDERSNRRNDFKYDGGIISFVEYLNKNKNVIHDAPIYIEGERDNMVIEVAFQYNDTYNEELFTFANNINTREGGSHLSGFRAALTRSINSYSASGAIPKNLQTKLSGDDLREGITAVISVKLPQPQFEGQTKTKLGNSEVKGLVETMVNERLAKYLDENPQCSEKNNRQGGGNRPSPGGGQKSQGFGQTPRESYRTIPCPENLPIARSGILHSAKYLSWRANQLEVPPNRAGTAVSKPYCP